MIAEIICVGSELLLGETINTNASYISKKLSGIGIDCLYHTVVGDNFKRIKNVLKTALERADIIITTGGLGPTDDDITIEAIANYFDEELILDENSLKRIEEFFKLSKREMHSDDKKQALRPKSALRMPNPTGSAPGIIWDVSTKFSKKRSKIILTFPGVPSELYSMWENTAESYLKTFSKDVILTRHLKYFGIAEAALAEKVRDLMEKENPTVAPLAGKGEARLRIAVKAKDLNKATELIETTEKEILSRTGEYFYGYNDDGLEQAVGKLLTRKKLSVSVAESCTGGLVSSRLTDVAGSSRYIKFNLVTYSNEAKVKQLGVNEKLLEKYGAVSDRVALSMAMGVRGVGGSDIGLAITGIAGPTGETQSKPVGLVYIGLCDKHLSEVYEVRISPLLTRAEIKYRASQHSLNYLRLFIDKMIV